MNYVYIISTGTKHTYNTARDILKVDVQKIYCCSLVKENKVNSDNSEYNYFVTMHESYFFCLCHCYAKEWVY